MLSWLDVKRYSIRYFFSDLFSSFSVALLAIPQSMAYSLLAEAPANVNLNYYIPSFYIRSVFNS